MLAAKKKVAIVGARGYSGLELARLLLNHSAVELCVCFAGESNFQLSDYLPESAAKKIPVKPLSEMPAMLADLDTVFLATPAEVSLELAPKILEKANVIDLSGAFRLKKGGAEAQKAQYQKWYKMEHKNPELLDVAQFGLVPFAKISAKSKPQLIANPGCYATSVMMAIIPLLQAGLIQKSSLVIDAKSGTSGAGRKAAENLLFNEVAGECLPYRVGVHQHLPEICEQTEFFSGAAIDPFFSTHLLPVRRGIISSIYAELNSETADILGAYQKAFANYPLVRVGEIDSANKEQMPANLGLSLKKVVGTARTHIYFKKVGKKLYLFSLIDNLLKGAASQAVENFNQLNGLPPESSLELLEGTL